MHREEKIISIHLKEIYQVLNVFIQSTSIYNTICCSLNRDQIYEMSECHRKYKIYGNRNVLAFKLCVNLSHVISFI